MPQQRMDIRMIKDILRLKYQGGLSHSAIAQNLSISKGAVAKYRRQAAHKNRPHRRWRKIGRCGLVRLVTAAGDQRACQ